jgi:hypothetical protein
VTDTPDYDAAFIVTRRKDGTFFVTDDLSTEFTVNRVGNLQDIKAGCRELLDRIQMLELTDSLIMALNTPNEDQTPEL